MLSLPGNLASKLAKKSNKSFDTDVTDAGDTTNNLSDDTPCDTEQQRDTINSELERNYRVMLDIKEKEIRRLQEMVDSSDKQLKIQTKVNEEVKRLLVASVGEDIEARVEFLTQVYHTLSRD